MCPPSVVDLARRDVRGRIVLLASASGDDEPQTTEMGVAETSPADTGYWMLAVMVCFTTLGLYLLSAANQ